MTSNPDPADGPRDVGAMEPTRRGALAGARASQLRQRLTELASGCAPTPAAAEFAERCARQAIGRAAAAQASALCRHDETRRVHLRAAAAHEQAAIVLNGLDSDGHQDAAERHRDAAAAHAAVIAAFTVEGPVRPRRRPSAVPR